MWDNIEMHKFQVSNLKLLATMEFDMLNRYNRRGSNVVALNNKILHIYFSNSGSPHRLCMCLVVLLKCTE